MIFRLILLDGTEIIDEDEGAGKIWILLTLSPLVSGT
jgi:hypothetical protein